MKMRWKHKETVDGCRKYEQKGNHGLEESNN